MTFKTIKELIKIIKSEQAETDGLAIYYTGQYDILVEVKKLIDVRLKQNDRALRAKSIGQAQYDWTKNELEELKSKINGEKEK